MNTLLDVFNAVRSGLGDLLPPALSQSGAAYWVLGLSLLLSVIGAATMIWTKRSARASDSAAAKNIAVKDDPHLVTPRGAHQAGNTMAGDDMRQMYHSILGIQRSLAQIASGMRESNEAIACAAGEIAASIRGMSAQAEARASRLDQAAQRIEELAAAGPRDDESRQSRAANPTVGTPASQVSQLRYPLQQLAHGGGANVDEIAATAAALKRRTDSLSQVVSRFEQTAVNGAVAPSPRDDAGYAGDNASACAAEWEKMSIPEVALSNEEINEIISQTWHDSGNKGPPPAM